jgi:hypothetical protein
MEKLNLDYLKERLNFGWKKNLEMTTLTKMKVEADRPLANHWTDWKKDVSREQQLEERE